VIRQKELAAALQEQRTYLLRFTQSDAASALFEHVVAGDKEQVTPDAVGQSIDKVQRLISTDLGGIPNSHLYDGQTSIYDLAETAFGGVVALREHFRCVPEIIQFSNHLSYNQKILPLREPRSAIVRPAILAHRVNGLRDTPAIASIRSGRWVAVELIWWSKARPGAWPSNATDSDGTHRNN
jgi:hypothetical protein